MRWKTIPGYPMYEVSDNGEVRNIKTGKKLSPQTDKDGYLKVWLFISEGKKQKPMFVHRLVGFAFVDGYFESAQINHKDENKQNNNADNLEWCDCNYNINYGSRTQRAIAHCERPVIAYKGGHEVARYKSTCEAMRATGIWQQNISKCCNKRAGFLTAGGYEWSYAK